MQHLSPLVPAILAAIAAIKPGRLLSRHLTVILPASRPAEGR
jgi:hypothetical protein